LKDAQKAFNAYIRLRDHDRPCISCGTTQAGQWHASHYRSVGAYPELRFDPNNCHKSCSTCNRWLSGNLLEYRRLLRIRYGDWLIDYLEGPHEPNKWTKEELHAIVLEYRKRSRAMAGNGSRLNSAAPQACRS
jgi:hypothetical protein